MPSKQLCMIAAALCALGYSAWSLWWPRSQQSAAGFVAAQPAVATEKISGPTVALKIVPKKAVQKKFSGVQISETEEVVDTAAIQPAPNGATAITVIDTISGTARTTVQMNEAPWVALERTNYLGIGYDLSTNGSQRARLYYKRDFLRIRDVHIQGSAQLSAPVNSVNGSIEGVVSGTIEYRF